MDNDDVSRIMTALNNEPTFDATLEVHAAKLPCLESYLNGQQLQPRAMNLKLTWALPPLIIKKQWEVVGRYIPVEAGPIGDIKGVEAWKEAICHQITYSRAVAEIFPEVKQEISLQI